MLFAGLRHTPFILKCYHPQFPAQILRGGPPDEGPVPVHHLPGQEGDNPGVAPGPAARHPHSHRQVFNILALIGFIH